MRNSKKFAIPVILLSALMLLSAGCSTRPNDDGITRGIQEKLAANPETKDSLVAVSSTGGKVTLTGKVQTPAVRQKVEQIAREAPGITGVDNQTTVQAEPAAVPQASAPASASTPPAVSTPPPTPTPAPSPAAEAANAASPNASAEKTPPAEPPKPQPIVIPAGTVLTVKTSQALSSKTSQAGQTFLATLAQPVSVGKKRALPAGATVSGRVVTAREKGKIKGEGELSVELTSISVGGHTYPIHTNTLDSTVKGKGSRTAKTTGGGAAGGALIGGIAGGGKGAGIGALVGAGAGLVGGAVTGNKQIEVPAESVLTFTLSEPLTLRPPSAG